MLSGPARMVKRSRLGNETISKRDEIPKHMQIQIAANGLELAPGFSCCSVVMSRQERLIGPD